MLLTQGLHQIPQKSSKTTLPRNQPSSSLAVSPVLRTCHSGAGCPIARVVRGAVFAAAATGFAAGGAWS